MTQLELDFGEEFAPPLEQTDEVLEMASECGFSLTHSGFVKLWLANSKNIHDFARMVETKFMDRLVKNTSICRQIVDAGLLSSDPSGFKKREGK